MVEELQPDDIAQWVHGWARLGGWSWSAVVAGCAAEDMVTPALFASPFLIRPRASSHVSPCCGDLRRRGKRRTAGRWRS